MGERLAVFEVRDRFATISIKGEVRIWEVDRDGNPKLEPFKKDAYVRAE